MGCFRLSIIDSPWLDFFILKLDGFLRYIGEVGFAIIDDMKTIDIEVSL